MNKRQKKKQVTRAMNHLGTDKLTAKDKEVLMTYGREMFIAKHQHPPEILDVDFSFITEAAERIREGIRNFFYEVGKAFIRMSGKDEEETNKC